MPVEKIIESKRVTITFDRTEETVLEKPAPVVTREDAEVIRNHLASLGIESPETENTPSNGDADKKAEEGDLALQESLRTLDCCENCRELDWNDDSFEMKERIAAHLAREEYHARKDKSDPNVAVEPSTPEQKAKDAELVQYWVNYFRNLWKTSTFDRPRKCQLCDDKFTVFEDQLKHYQLTHDCHLICINAHVVKNGSKKKGTYREKRGYMVELLLMGKMYALSNV